ncbi:MAG: SRPBCC domain-containing protein [Rhizomicrobium sp.]
MKTCKHAAIGAVLAVFCVAGAHAAVTGATANGLGLRETAHIAAPPGKVYAALIEPSRWWSSEHTFSGNAANMSFDARAGGCWCEKLPHGGSVLHMTVVYVDPGKTLRLRGALGPFQGMAVDGAMTWTLEPANGGTDITMTYDLGGFVDGGFQDMAPKVDGVLGEQIGRLQTFIETGSPDAATAKQ